MRSAGRLTCSDCSLFEKEMLCFANAGRRRNSLSCRSSFPPSFAAEVEKAPPPAPYKKVSELVKLPDFLPGIGTLYVDPRTCRGDHS